MPGEKKDSKFWKKALPKDAYELIKNNFWRFVVYVVSFSLLILFVISTFF